MGFQSVFINVLIMLFYMACGYVLVKGKKAFAEHAKSLSGLLIYVCGPALVISSFQSIDYSLENFGRSCLFMAICLAVQMLFFGILFMIIGKKYENARYRILSAGAVFGNVGYFGIPVINGLFPNEPITACYSIMYITGMNVLIFTVGVYLITKNRKYMSLKAAIFNPTVLGFIAAAILYFAQIRLPDAVGGTLSLLGKMTAPLCMVILGMRLSTMELKGVFTNWFAYLASALKLIVFPLFTFVCVWFLPFLDTSFKVTLFVLSATPAAAMILSLAELYGYEQKLSANIVLLTTVCSVVTMPLLILLLL